MNKPEQIPLPDETIAIADSLNAVADFAEAIRALQRVSGYRHNHDTLLLACLAAANERGSDVFSASFAELGARMSGEVEPYKRNLTQAERKHRRRALEQRFRRAFKRLKTDQEATGLWLVTVRSGGFSDGERVKSTIRVEVEAITRVVRLARESDDCKDFRLRCFERAAGQVRDSMPRPHVAPSVAWTDGRQRADDELSQVRRYVNSIKGYSRRLYNLAADEGIADAHRLKELLQGNIERWFTVDFPVLREAEQESAEREATRPARMGEIAAGIRNTASGKVHASDPHT